MQTEEYKKQSLLEQKYWWFAGRRFIINGLLETHLIKKSGLSILDYGSGTGGNFPILGKFGKVIGADISKTAIELSKEKYPNAVYQITEENPLPFPPESFDLIAVLDVLEHIKEDRQFLSNIKSCLKNDGLILISVPAYQFLWSEHDESLNHFRRYAVKNLIEKIRSAGFNPIYFSYAITFAFPVIAAYRIIKRGMDKLFGNRHMVKASYVMLPPLINNLFVMLLKLEAFLMKHIKLPFGSSIFLIAKR